MVLEAIALTHLRDADAIKKHESAGGMQWRGTEAGVGTLTKADAKELWLRYGTGQKVWFDQGYDLSKYVGARASKLAIHDWLWRGAPAP